MGFGACRPGLEDTLDWEAGVLVVRYFSEDLLEDVEHVGAYAGWNLINKLYNHSVKMCLE